MSNQKPFLFFFLIFHITFTFQIYSSNWFHKEDKKSLHYTFSNSLNPVLWGKPLEEGTLKILALTPQYCSLDFLELEKRVDCNIHLITTEDSMHLGCDPLWGIWCSEEYRSDTIIKRIKNYMEKKWDLIIIAGIQLDILPREVYELIINKTAKGSGLLLIPSITDTSSSPHSVEDFINNLESISGPSERWIDLFSGGNSEIKTDINNISVVCTEYEKGRIAFLKNYLNGVVNHVLLPEKAVINEMTYLENAWAGIISLILWCSHISGNCKILNISDAKPAGPVEEEIPPELPMMVIRNLNQSLLGPGTFPFYIEIERKDKQKVDGIRIQIRRENEYFSYQQYEFKPNLQKQGNTFTQVELPIGAGNYFLDAWLIRKGKILDFFSKRFTFTSWPEILSVEPNKKFVFPNDSITLKVNILPDIMENREGTIIVQGVDNYPYLPSTEGNFVCEQSKPITGKGGEVSITLNFADLRGNYLKINVWGASTRVNLWGENYSTLFSYRSLYIPVQRKLFKKEWKDFVQLNDIREYNQLQIARFFMENLNCGNYLSIEQCRIPNIAKLYQPCIVELVEESSESAVNKNLRNPCINDENYLNRRKEEITQIVSRNIMPTPYAISLGMNNCLVRTEEWVCFCEHCINKFKQTVQLEGYLEDIPQLAEKFALSGIEKLKEEVVNKNFPSYLFLYKNFMETSFINFEIDLKNKLKTFFPEIPIGFRYYNENESIRCIDWIKTINSMDWVVLEPDPFAYSIIPYIKSKNKSFWVSLDFGNPQLKPEEIAWHYWNAILNQANGVWFLNVNGDINHSNPIKSFTEGNKATSSLASIIHINEKLQGGLKDLFLQLKPDYNEEIGIYYSPENLFLTSNYPEFSHKNSFVHFTRLLNGFGINPVIITKENILTSEKLKVLVLPCCLWLSEEEIENLSEFLDRGIIVADISPGIISGSDLMRDLQDITNNQDTITINIKSDNMITFNKCFTKKIDNQPIEEIREEIIFIQNAIKRGGIEELFFEENEWIDGKFYSFNNGEIFTWQPHTNPIKVNEEVNISNDLFKNKCLRDLLSEKNIRKKNKIYLNISANEPFIMSSSPDSQITLDLSIPGYVNKGSRIPVKIALSEKNNINMNTWVNIEFKDKKTDKILFSEIFDIKIGDKKEIFINTSKNLPSGWYLISVKDITTGLKKVIYIKIE